MDKLELVRSRRDDTEYLMNLLMADAYHVKREALKARMRTRNILFLVTFITAYIGICLFT